MSQSGAVLHRFLTFKEDICESLLVSINWFVVGKWVSWKAAENGAPSMLKHSFQATR